MRQLILLAALALGAASASATSFGDYFKVSFEGRELADGETITIREPEYSDEWGEAWAAHINVANLQDEYRPIYGEAAYVIPATRTLLLKEADCRAQICFYGAEGGIGNCLPNGTESLVGFTYVNVPAAGEDTFEWAVDLNYDMACLNDPVTILLTMSAAEGDAFGECKVIEGTEFTVTIKYQKESVGVDTVGAEGAEVEWYDMQGMRVSSPAKGLHIVRQGGKVTKRVI